MEPESEPEAVAVDPDELIESNTDELTVFAHCECCGYTVAKRDIDLISGWCPACRAAVDGLDDCPADGLDVYIGPLFEGCKSQD
jgi:hypothetical protein